MSAVDDVKARLDIVDVVGGYVRLQKAGRYFKAACPFHTEKTPSFVVYPDRQSWHCFGACGIGGDVISFVSRKENLDFGSALRLLADRAGVELPTSGHNREQIKTLHDANDAASLYYHSLLQTATGARAYLDERGLNNQAVNDFQIGFAPTGWDGLKTHLLSRGYAEGQLVEAGLLIEGDRGAYDRFRGRLMFPIRDERGRVTGFGGRILPDPNKDGQSSDEGPKYMNTPQTPIFDKGGTLYGLDRAKDAIRNAGTAVIVEGYMDVIAAHQHSFGNVVASMGTALTERQAIMIQRLGNHIILAMDSDEAGNTANLRGMQVVAATTAPLGSRVKKAPIDLRVLALPEGKDPDELIRADPTAWSEAIDAARPVIDHLLAVVGSGLDLSQPLDRSQLATEVLPVIAEVTDPVLQAHYLQRLSRLARTSEDALRRQFPRQARPSSGRASNQRQSQNKGTPGPKTTTPAQPVRLLASPREEFCLAMLFQVPEVAQLAADDADINEDLFSLSENQELFRRWQKGQPPTEETEGDSPWVLDQFRKVLATRIPAHETSQAKEAFLDCVARLRTARMKFAKEASAMALAEGEAGVPSGQVASIAQARLEAGESKESDMDIPAELLAAQLLQDMEAGLLFHGRVIEISHPKSTAQDSNQETD